MRVFSWVLTGLGVWWIIMGVLRLLTPSDLSRIAPAWGLLTMALGAALMFAGLFIRAHLRNKALKGAPDETYY